MITVKELKEILENFKDDDIFCVYDMERTERYLPKISDIDECIEGYFEVNIDDTNLC